MLYVNGAGPREANSLPWEVRRRIMGKSEMARRSMLILQPIRVSYHLHPPLLLPPAVEELAGERMPRQVVEVAAFLFPLTLELRGERGVGELSSLRLKERVAIFLLWDLLRRRGIDFLADLRRRLEERREKLERFYSTLSELDLLLGVALA
ncbi:MAG: hypothetical protein QXJ59_06140 [Thermofilaceae archaeon]